MKRYLHLIPIALALAGCAKTPPGAVTGPQTLVTFEVQVQGSVNPAEYYYIVLDTNNDASDGPRPVVARPWGNGYAAGSYTHYILYHAGTFGVYQSSDNPDHQMNVYLGRPLQAGVESRNNASDTLVVQLDAAQVANVNPAVRALDVNIIATDRVPLDPQEITTKTVDGLGLSGADFVTIPLTYTQVYQDGVNPDPGHPETLEAGIVPGLAEHPELDLINWRTTVQRG
ncbi:MAG TPA: hypothetical protein VGM37_09800 [Armatimonadota bacterium]|jgi:hypothetical protein